MKKPILSLCSAIFLIAPSLLGLATPFAAHAEVPTNALVKGSGPALYWVANNNKRYVFPNIKTFWSWFSSDKFSDVVTVSDAELASIPLGGNVVYRPGAKLVKITTDPKVYAVSRNGVLHWFTTEALAKIHYGTNWASQVEDVPDAFFVNYTIGSPVVNPWDYNGGNEYNGVTNPSDTILVSLPTDALAISLSKYEITKGEQVTLTATLASNAQAQVSSIELWQGENVLKACGQATTCSMNVTVNDPDFTKTFQARATYLTANGTKYIESPATTLRVNVPSMNLKGSTLVASEIFPATDGEPVVRIVASAVNPSITDSYVSIRIYTAKNQRLIQTCVGTITCAATDTSYRGITQPIDAKYFAIVSDDKGGTLPTVETIVNVVPKSWLSNYNQYVFTAQDVGVKTGLTQEIESQSPVLTLGPVVLKYKGADILATDENAAIAPGDAVHFEASVLPQKPTDQLTVELRDQDGTVYKTCNGTGAVLCSVDVILMGEYKNHLFVVRAKDQLGRTRDFRLPHVAYVVGKSGFGGNNRIIINQTSAKRGDTVQLSTKIVNQISPIAKLNTRIYNLETGMLITSCIWTTECKTKTLIDTDMSPLNYYTIAVDEFGREMHAHFLGTPLTVTK